MMRPTIVSHVSNQIVSVATIGRWPNALVVYVVICSYQHRRRHQNYRQRLAAAHEIVAVQIIFSETLAFLRFFQSTEIVTSAYVRSNRLYLLQCSEWEKYKLLINWNEMCLEFYAYGLPSAVSSSSLPPNFFCKRICVSRSNSRIASIVKPCHSSCHAHAWRWPSS